MFYQILSPKVFGQIKISKDHAHSFFATGQAIVLTQEKKEELGMILGN